MRRIILTLFFLSVTTVLYATSVDEVARRDENMIPVEIQVSSATGKIKQLRCTEDGRQLVVVENELVIKQAKTVATQNYTLQVTSYTVSTIPASSNRIQIVIQNIGNEKVFLSTKNTNVQTEGLVLFPNTGWVEDERYTEAYYLQAPNDIEPQEVRVMIYEK